MPDLALFNIASGQSATMAPLGVLYVAAAAEDAGYTVSFHDYALESGPDLFSVERIARFLAQEDTAVIGISCFANMLPYVALAAARLRALRPDIRIILGGPGPSAVAARLMERFPAIDMVVVGEGEETIVETLRSLRSGAPRWGSIPGLVWRNRDGSVVRNQPRARARELDRISPPAYHHVDLRRYDVVGVIYARGCPYACTYCDVVSMWNRKNIARSLENVLLEIERLRVVWGVRHVAFVDDLFTVDRRRTLEFCREFRARGAPVTWGCTTRIDRVDGELLETMADAGCTYAFYGVESGSPKILARVNKVIPFAQTAEAVKRSAALGMYVHTPLMWGFPFEEIADFRETLAFGQFLGHCGANVFYTLATPLPATALYDEFKDRLAFRADIYSTIIAPGRAADLSEVASAIGASPHLFSGFYHFADGRVDEKIAIGRGLGLTLSDIRISSLTARDSSCVGA
jgi:radical SAM superfamily enzyme YgiQ (UPF0313 family)